jgi:hypothetical protein
MSKKAAITTFPGDHISSCCLLKKHNSQFVHSPCTCRWWSFLHLLPLSHPVRTVGFSALNCFNRKMSRLKPFVRLHSSHYHRGEKQILEQGFQINWSLPAFPPGFSVHRQEAPALQVPGLLWLKVGLECVASNSIALEWMRVIFEQQWINRPFVPLQDASM